jgi:hypothetical protein
LVIRRIILLTAVSSVLLVLGVGCGGEKQATRLSTGPTLKHQADTGSTNEKRPVPD